MNNFSKIDAQDELSSCVRVTSDEVSEYSNGQNGQESALDKAAKAVNYVYQGVGPNVGKLVLHNLCLPMERRVSRLDLARKVAGARLRGAMIGLHASIHAECEPQRQAMREAEAIFDF